VKPLRSLAKFVWHVIAAVIAGLVGHVALIVLSLLRLPFLGGEYASFAAGAIQLSLTVTLSRGLGSGALAGDLWLLFGPFFAPILVAVVATALIAAVFGWRRLTVQAGLAVIVSTTPIALRSLTISPGAPTPVPGDIGLVALCAAIAAVVYWTLAGRTLGAAARRSG